MRVSFVALAEAQMFERRRVLHSCMELLCNIHQVVRFNMLEAVAAAKMLFKVLRVEAADIEIRSHEAGRTGQHGVGVGLRRHEDGRVVP